MGDSAGSLEEFVKKIEEIDAKSLEFHLYRGDFEKWAETSLQDNMLVERLRKIRFSKMKGRTLKKYIIEVVKRARAHGSFN